MRYPEVSSRVGTVASEPPIFPERTDPAFQAEELRLLHQYARKVGPKYHWNTLSFIQGHTVNTIIGDDINFIPPWPQFYTAEQLAGLKPFFLRRLQIERDTPELPAPIRKSVHGVLAEVERLEWSDGKQYLRAYTVWDERLCSPLKTMVHQSAQWRSMSEYATDLTMQYSGEFNAYLNSLVGSTPQKAGHSHRQ